MLNLWHNVGEGSSRVVELEDDEDESTGGLTTPEAPENSQRGPPAPKTYALPAEWEQHRERIRQLYLDENKPLREVMSIMEREYGHCGSIKQYKNKLRDWGFDTKYKRHQTSRKRRNRLLRRHTPVVSHRSLTSPAHSQAPDALATVGYNVEAPEAQDNERKNEHLSFLALSQAVGLQSGRAATPPMSIAEQIFVLAQRHVETSFQYGFWKADSRNNVCTSMTCTKEEMDLPEMYFDLIRSAVLLFEQGSPTEGHHVVSKAFALVKPILKSGNVRALNFFWTSLVFLVQFGHAAIVVRLIQYIHDMAQIVLHPGHPVVRMFELLTWVDLSELESLVHSTWQITADAFQKELPRLHPEYVRHQCDLIFRVYGTRDPAAAEQRLRQLLADCENTPAHQAPELSHLTVLNALGYNFMNCKDWVSAVDIGQKLEERARHAPQDDADDGVDLLVYLIGGMEIQARAFNELKLTRLAVKCLKQATPLIAEHWGESDPWRIELMALQQKWLRDSGDIKAADELKAEIARITERIDTD